MKFSDPRRTLPRAGPSLSEPYCCPASVPDLRGVNRKPVIGLAGGIGSGKSLVARMLQRLGALIIDADELAKASLEKEDVKSAIKAVWGEEVLTAAGQIDRAALAARVFSEPQGLRMLEYIIHPQVLKAQRNLCHQANLDSDTKAVVIDAPLLFEAYLDFECDFVIFVDAGADIRAARVAERGWSPEELARREQNQLPLDFKKDRAEYIVKNDSDADTLRCQVEQVFGRILSLAQSASRIGTRS